VTLCVWSNQKMRNSVRSVWLIFVLFTVLLLPTIRADEDEESDDKNSSDEVDLSAVTCGSVVKLRHVATEARLHSHQVTYGGGSGQQSVTAVPNIDDTNSFWIVKAAYGKPPCRTGSAFKNGDVVRFLHLNTQHNLHSHLHKSPLSNQQEVSAYGDENTGDTGDNWKLTVKNGGDTWKRQEVVQLQHVDTGKFLSSNKNKFGNPIPGQQEVCCIDKKNEPI